MEIYIDDTKLKAMLKEALAEAIADRKEVICDILSKVIEDIGLARSIREGEASVSINRKKII